MAFYERVPWPAVGVLMVMPYDPELHAPGGAGRQGICSWSDHDVEARWSVVWRGERWAVCDSDLLAFARHELGAEKPAEPKGPAPDLEAQFRDHVVSGLNKLKRHYNPTIFFGMVRDKGAVGAAKQLLADPRHTSYGFEKIWEMGELDTSVEFAVCLPWFNELFTSNEIAEAERRLLLHDFPLRERLAAATARPPKWTR